MMMRLQKMVFVAATAAVFVSCKKDNDPIIVVPPSTGSSLQLSGLTGSESSGANAGNSVFVDLSKDKQTAAARNSWDLGFYCGSDFRVIINNTTSATAKVLAKNDLAAVGTADTVGLNKLAIGFDLQSWALVDDSLGDLSKTVIPAVSAVDADNKVVILNPGTGGGVTAKDLYKIRVLRSGSGGYRLQYAKLAATVFSTIEIPKVEDFHFRYFSLESGSIVTVEPEKENWDFKWSYSLYKTFYAVPSVNANIPYGFSDLITINNRAGVQAAEVLTSMVTYDAYAKSNVSATTFSSLAYAIADKWRSTSPATGVRTDRFYVIKDPAGNYYKVKFKAMGAGDGGTRGKPEFEYKLVQ